MTIFEQIADCKLEEIDFLDLEKMKEEIEEEMKKRLDKITEVWYNKVKKRESGGTATLLGREG